MPIRRALLASNSMSGHAPFHHLPKDTVAVCRRGTAILAECTAEENVLQTEIQAVAMLERLWLLADRQLIMCKRFFLIKQERIKPYKYPLR